MNNDEDLSSRILTNIDIITDIYDIIKEAGQKTVNNASVIESRNDVTVIKANVKGLTRATANCLRPGTNDLQCRKSSRYSIQYDANDIMIVGGAALNVYDYALREFKARHEIAELESYIKKKTSDIDIVWWPTNIKSSSNELTEVVTSSSPAIVTLVNTLKDELAILFEKNKNELESKIRKIVPNATNSDRLIIELGGDKYNPGMPIHTWKAGTWTIVITFKIKGKSFKICEIIIHDSGASQLYNEIGEEINKLQFMSADPVYCSPDSSSPNHISYLDINKSFVAVPNILSFVKQQLLAFNNLLGAHQPQVKGFINYKRVEYIRRLLLSVQETNNEYLIDIFKTDNSKYPLQVVRQINIIEEKIIPRLKPNIERICKSMNISDDTILKELCGKVNVSKSIPLLPSSSSMPVIPSGLRQALPVRPLFSSASYTSSYHTGSMVQPMVHPMVKPIKSMIPVQHVAPVQRVVSAVPVTPDIYKDALTGNPIYKDDKTGYYMMYVPYTKRWLPVHFDQIIRGYLVFYPELNRWMPLHVEKNIRYDGRSGGKRTRRGKTIKKNKI